MKIIEYIECPLCGSTSYTLKYIIKGYPTLKCIHCNLIRTRHHLSSQNILDIYKNDYFKKSSHQSLGYSDYFAMEKQLRSNFSKRVTKIIADVGKNEFSLLEIGSGPGFFLVECVNRGINAQGIEISKEAVEFAKKMFSLEIQKTSLEYFKTKKRFDVVCAWDVIEHVAEPDKFLDEIFAMLNPNGTIYISTGNVESLMAKLSGRHWHLYSPPAHLFFFSKNTLRDLLEMHGYNEVNISYPSQWYSINYLLERLLKGTIHNQTLETINYHKINLLDKISLPINLFDIMEVSARKSNN